MKLHLQNVGQITDASIDFGDLTVFVGPQASGKSISLQWVKLLNDLGAVQDDLQKQGLAWRDGLDSFFNIYFGEGMSSMWGKKSKVTWQGKNVDIKQKFLRQAKNKKENVLLIPAQRVLALRDGWPRAFSDYTAGDPYSVRSFSEHLRHLVSDKRTLLFPCSNQMKEVYRNALNRSIFGGFKLEVDKRLQKRLILKDSKDNSLPYMVWSAGQREFVPLLLGLNDLMPGGKVTKGSEVNWVIIEELEMGLHPKAITAILLLILELLFRGYKVCLSTHSPQVLELLWAMKILRENNAEPGDLLALFEAGQSAELKKVAREVLNKELKVYFFDSDDGKVKDISNLESFGADGGCFWGGLLSFTDRSNDVVADVVARNQ